MMWILSIKVESTEKNHSEIYVLDKFENHRHAKKLAKLLRFIYNKIMNLKEER